MPDKSISTEGAAPLTPATIALAVIGWIMQDQDRAERYLALTGLTPDSLRAALSSDEVLASALDFLANHEPDFIRAADDLALSPQQLQHAREELTR